MKFDNFKIDTWDIFPNPCYNPQARYGNPPETFYDLMCDERIPAVDRIWAFAYCKLIPDNIKLFAAVRFVRETPIGDGLFFIDVIKEKHILNSLDVAQRYAQGLATYNELTAAWPFAVVSHSSAAWGSASDAAMHAKTDEAGHVVNYAAWAAQIKIIKSMINTP